MVERPLLHRRLTSFAVRRTDALLADCRRDIDFARKYGLRTECKTLVLPGNGGVDLRLFSPGLDAGRRERLIVFPRGLHPYMQTDVLLAAISLLFRESAYKNSVFILLATPATVGILKEMAAKRNLAPEAVRVLAFMSRPKLAALLQRADAIVSPSLTDGTPNSMLEAMACGALPVMSRLSSIMEWIRHGENGLLFDANDAFQLADCLRQALADSSLKKQAQDINYALVREKADYERVMPSMRDFLKEL
jgi:glycosyltransferase involved in cell wall biosynthesis